MRCFLQILLWTTPVVSVALAFSPTGDPNSPSAAPVYGHKIINTYPHDANAFTQGLVFDGGVLYESTGGYGESTLREVELETGKVVRVRELPDEFFGEGVTIYGGKIIQLTWKARAGFVYDKETLRPLRTFKYPTEGWGVTHDGARLIMSDGTTVLHLLEPNSLRRIGGIRVHDNNSPVTGINELEYCRGRIYANIWPADRIAMIDPNTGAKTSSTVSPMTGSGTACLSPVSAGRSCLKSSSPRLSLRARWEKNRFRGPNSDDSKLFSLTDHSAVSAADGHQPPRNGLSETTDSWTSSMRIRSSENWQGGTPTTIISAP
jgi:glutamine cyclotransferase